MFRGGSTGSGITSGLVPRQGYDNGKLVESAEERRKVLSELAGQRPDRSLSNFMIDFGLDIASRPPSGNIFQTAAASAREPFQRFQTATERRGAFDRKIGLAAATSAMAQSDKMAQIAEASKYKNVDTELEKLTAFYLDEYKDYYLANNRAKFDLQIRGQIANAFGDSQVGGIIDQDALSTESLTKKWMKQNGGKINMVFYDINDGQTKRLVQQAGKLGFEVIESSALTGTAPDIEKPVQEQKVTSTGLSQEQAQVEAEKRGYILITRPEDAPRGWLSEQKRREPNSITITELEEIIRKEEFAAYTETIKKPQTIAR
jgi:hypothetical protein